MQRTPEIVRQGALDGKITVGGSYDRLFSAGEIPWARQQPVARRRGEPDTP